MADADNDATARPSVNLLDKVKIWEGSADPSALDPANRNGWRAYRIRTIMFLTACLCWNGMVDEGLKSDPMIKLQIVDGLGGKSPHNTDMTIAQARQDGFMYLFHSLRAGPLMRILLNVVKTAGQPLIAFFAIIDGLLLVRNRRTMLKAQRVWTGMTWDYSRYSLSDHLTYCDRAQ